MGLSLAKVEVREDHLGAYNNLRSQVRVSGTLLNCMSQFLATIASYLDLLLRELFVINFIIMVFLRLVLGISAARGVLILFAAAPPDFATVLASVRPTAPIEILCFDVVFPTVLADLLLVVELSPPQLELLHTLFHLLSVHDQAFLFLLKLHFRLKVLICFICLQFQFPFLVMLQLPIDINRSMVLILEFESFFNQLLRLLHVEVSFLRCLSNIVAQLLGLLVLRIKSILLHLQFKFKLGLLGLCICDLFNGLEEEDEVLLEHLIFRVVQYLVLFQFKRHIVESFQFALILLHFELVSLPHSFIEIRDLHHHITILSHALDKGSHFIIIAVGFIEVQVGQVQLLLLLFHLQLKSV